MLIQVLRAKIQPATVTEANIAYEGSIGIDEALIKAAGFYPNEKVHVLNLNNGSRAETYIIKSERDKGQIVMNGAIARLAEVGDQVIILSYGIIDESEAASCKPSIVLLDAENKIRKIV